jgi:hypothetical protein
MSKRYGRNRKRRHLAEIERLQGLCEDFARAAWQDTEQIAALRNEVARWRPRVRIEERMSDPRRITICHDIDRMTLECTNDPDSVIEYVGQLMMHEWHRWRRSNKL